MCCRRCIPAAAIRAQQAQARRPLWYAHRLGNSVERQINLVDR
jgi:hypothetical protein